MNRAAILLTSLLLPIYLAVARADADGGPANLLELRSEVERAYRDRGRKQALGHHMLGAITMFDRGITIIAILFCWLAGRPVHADDFSGMQDDPFAVAVEQLADGVYVARRSRLDIA